VKAVVVPEPGATLAEADVVDHVAERLADFKKPREVTFREELPRNPTGKVVKEELE
jgi:acyl-coenzyme A synthetase/AMP-(fatty) acid ligase